MNILVWNCYRLGNLHTRNGLGDIIQAKNPSGFFYSRNINRRSKADTVLPTLILITSGWFLEKGVVVELHYFGSLWSTSQLRIHPNTLSILVLTKILTMLGGSLVFMGNQRLQDRLRHRIVFED